MCDVSSTNVAPFLFVVSAGSVMYEHGMRLGCEVPGKQGLQRQAQCYLSALNALRLVKPEYSWIIKPTLVTKQNVNDFYYMNVYRIFI